MPVSHHDFGGLRAFDRVLAVVAHPDDETFGLGGIISRLTRLGTTVGVLSLTRGEASTQGADPELGSRRAEEYRKATELLGVASATVADLPDGGLDREPAERLAGPISDAIAELEAEVLLTFDTTGVTGHADHRATTQAVISAAGSTAIPAMGWTISARVARTLNQEFGTAFKGRSEFEIDYVLPVKRKAQRKAITAHQSQAEAFPLVHRRLDLTGPIEWTRWLRHPGGQRPTPDWDSGYLL